MKTKSVKIIFKCISIASMLTIFSGCSDDISSVKNGVLPEYSNSITLGQALDGWSEQGCDSTNWESITTDRGEKIVQFICEIDGDKFKASNDNELSDSLSYEDFLNAEKDLVKKQDISNQANPNSPKEYEDAHSQYKEASEYYNKVNHILPRRNIEQAKYILQFVISADSQTFQIGDSQTEFLMKNGYVFKTSGPLKPLMVYVYSNEKISALDTSSESPTEDYFTLSAYKEAYSPTSERK